jgi:hypothetical protein
MKVSAFQTSTELFLILLKINFQTRKAVTIQPSFNTDPCGAAYVKASNTKEVAVLVKQCYGLLAIGLIRLTGRKNFILKRPTELLAYIS